MMDDRERIGVATAEVQALKLEELFRSAIVVYSTACNIRSVVQPAEFGSVIWIEVDGERKSGKWGWIQDRPDVWCFRELEEPATNWAPVAQSATSRASEASPPRIGSSPRYVLDRVMPTTVLVSSEPGLDWSDGQGHEVGDKTDTRSNQIIRRNIDILFDALSRR